MILAILGDKNKRMKSKGERTSQTYKTGQLPSDCTTNIVQATRWHALGSNDNAVNRFADLDSKSCWVHNGVIARSVPQ